MYAGIFQRVPAAHHDAAFNAPRYAIDTLKQIVPVWQKKDP